MRSFPVALTVAAALFAAAMIHAAQRRCAEISGWYSARFHYFTNGTPKVTSFTLHVATASTPDLLDSAEEAVLGGRTRGGAGARRRDVAADRPRRGARRRDPAIASPTRPSSPLATHFGCRAFEMSALDPPRVARDDAGRLRVRASVTVTDQQPFGPSSCGYDAQSVTGVVIARRDLQPELVATLNASRLRP